MIILTWVCLGEKLVFALQSPLRNTYGIPAAHYPCRADNDNLPRRRLGENLAGKKGKKNAASDEPAPVQQSAAAGTPLPGTQSQGTLELDGVDEPTAAVIMAIVSDESGIPLNRLLFKSIKKKD